ncbi:RING finger protein 141-like [Mercenaria mercenaria]|uniref:RING finger protein 141-like n=1 Tax=Mercenaria mercenaria TaxID=6596 RepID=UPI00234E83BF|nr:RING finger protein 141-like [Mercenaria mercenaria]XP_045176252.2 RING finger protein 141-like [Mercenaria mercenaria]XP_045176253.2 RING finger protein 141-like [Mercenaria mercenaria]XP_053385309.1 RING finger protein 141-like [Mercenaria mercenaria]
MGQQGSTHDRHTVDIVHGKLKQHSEILRRIAKLSYKEFRDSLTELNEVTSTFTDQHGKQLHFNIVSGTDDTILWKGTVKIQCRKVLPGTNRVCSVRDLSIRQYIMVYKEITEQVANLQPATPGGTAARIDICASMILDEAEHKSLEVEDECCICMQNEAKTILPCTHKFCENCCREWTDTHCTCPICRAKVASSADTWELTDPPDSTEYATEVREVLVGIADRHSRNNQT